MSDFELTLVTIADATLVGGWILSATGKGGKALVTGVVATRVARGALITNAATDVIQAGIAVNQAVDEPTAAGIVLAACVATAAIFGLHATIVKGNKLPKPTLVDDIAPNTLRVVGGSQSAPARFVRTVQPGEKISDLIADGKAATWVDEAEHAIVSLAGDGKSQRVIVSGGRDGIEFIEKKGQLFFEMNGNLVQVRRIIGHTHPRATGPSQGDLEVLKTLGQTRSYIIEIGGEPCGTTIRPK